MIRGIHTCGKTHTVKEFGTTRYPNTAYFDLVLNPTVSNVLDGSLDTEMTLDKLAEIGNTSIDDGTLLIVDGIQASPGAIECLRRISRDRPRIHVICVTLPRIRVPKGIPVTTMRPMSLGEWATACGEREVTEMLRKEYIFTGGIPGAVSAWASDRDAERVRRIQNNILFGYGCDISGRVYRATGRPTNVWGPLPALMRGEVCPKWYKTTLGLLTWEGLVHGTAGGTRLCDVGLLGAMMNVSKEFVASDFPGAEHYRELVEDTISVTERACSEDRITARSRRSPPPTGCTW
ncbi:MAG: AAA family ATPase [Thermoplasmata archaeon]|nr:AAA family ATPase [Thermoplasmata archaeon]